MKKIDQTAGAFQKVIRNTIFKGLIALLGVTTIGISSGVAPVNTANASSLMAFREVTDSQVITYLNNLGYTGVVIYQILQDGTRKCTSTNHPNYWTYVYMSQPDHTSITGHEDIPF